MKAETKEEAERAWAEKSDIYNVPDHPYSEGFLDAIDLYKSALRAEIEESIEQERQVLANPKGYHFNDVAQCRLIVSQAEKFLNLMDTIKPTQE